MTEKTETGHWFANHGMGWAVSDVSREDAIEKLLMAPHITDPKWVRNCLKDGNVLGIYSCYVPVPKDTPYKIAWFVPEVEGVRDGANHMVTYLTKTKCAYMRDPSDAANKLRKEAERALESVAEAIREHKSYHCPEVRQAMADAGLKTEKAGLEIEEYKSKTEDVA